MSNILIVEDEDAIRRVLKKVLSEENPNYKLDEAPDGEKAISLIRTQHYDLVLCDIKMPKRDGVEVLEFISSYDSSIPVILISGHGDLKTAVKAMRMGAYDYIEKPPDLNILLNSVRSALVKTKTKNISKKTKKTKKTNSKYEIIGESKQIKNVKQLIEKIAPTNAKVLILGPNGSGKELVARQIHSSSLRSNGPFIEVNCAAIPSELIESELFGHIKGSFTSAHKDRIGKFEAANEGTIFLDEIGDMSLSAQSKVLRAIQENKIQKVGSDKDIYVDTRVIAATNKNITELIKSNKFREDLYHRISVIELNVPSLNDRKPDIPLLIEYFIQQLTDQYDGRHLYIDESGIKKMISYDWKGNVRELRNIVERLFILSESDQISEKEVVKYSGKKL